MSLTLTWSNKKELECQSQILDKVFFRLKIMIRCLLELRAKLASIGSFRSEESGRDKSP